MAILKLVDDGQKEISIGSQLGLELDHIDGLPHLRRKEANDLVVEDPIETG